MRKLCLILFMLVSFNAFAVVNGNEAVPHSKPYQVALDIDGQYFCGGVLISPEWVLTAAHCVDGAGVVWVTLGAHNINAIEPEQVKIRSTDFFTHENWNSYFIANDIALIRLPAPVTLNGNINTIPMAEGPEPLPSTQTSGWGKNSDSAPVISAVLREGSMTPISVPPCNAIYGIVTDRQICTTPPTAGTCNGDSGGPLVYNGKLFGITSFGPSAGCESGLPDGFSDVRAFREWIRANSGI